MPIERSQETLDSFCRSSRRRPIPEWYLCTLHTTVNRRDGRQAGAQTHVLVVAKAQFDQGRRSSSVVKTNFSEPSFQSAKEPFGRRSSKPTEPCFGRDGVSGHKRSFPRAHRSSSEFMGALPSFLNTLLFFGSTTSRKVAPKAWRWSTVYGEVSGQVRRSSRPFLFL